MEIRLYVGRLATFTSYSEALAEAAFRGLRDRMGFDKAADRVCRVKGKGSVDSLLWKEARHLTAHEPSLGGNGNAATDDAC